MGPEMDLADFPTINNRKPPKLPFYVMFFMFVFFLLFKTFGFPKTPLPCHF